MPMIPRVDDSRRIPKPPALPRDRFDLDTVLVRITPRLGRLLAEEVTDGR
jgi:hypothetical protein